VGEQQHPIGWGTGPYTLTYDYTNWSDGLRTVPGAQTALRGQHERPAAISYAGENWRTVFAAFPFETLAPTDAGTLMERTLGWLSWLGSSTWTGSARIIAPGDQVEMTCQLHNDGWHDLDAASFQTLVPPGLSLVLGSLDAETWYDPGDGTVHWSGPLAAGETRVLTFTYVADGDLATGDEIAFPARIGYTEHDLEWELPYYLRVDAPDLSRSRFAASPSVAAPSSTLQYSLAVRNTGLAPADVSIYAALPDTAVFSGTVESGGIGSSWVLTRTMSWSGTIAPGEDLLLHYAALLDPASDYTLTHDVRIDDQYGEHSYLEARTRIVPHRIFLPLIVR
jgi:uncharacterized repeat protein (TIGR01451 family)